LYNTDLEKANFQKADLSDTDLRFTLFSRSSRDIPRTDCPRRSSIDEEGPDGDEEGPGGADFREATLENTNFAGANLIKADFRGATISATTNFEAATLTCADFRRAKGCVKLSYYEEDLSEDQRGDIDPCPGMIIEPGRIIE
jgi:uncharacterized protein YjbI with pentapeptide repeats